MAKKNAAVAKRKKTDPLTLTEAIDALKRDLRSGIKDKKFVPMFEIVDATVEIGVSFDRTVEPGASVNVFVATLSAKASEKTAATHKVALKLRMLDDKDLDRLVASGEIESPKYRGAGEE